MTYPASRQDGIDYIRTVVESYIREMRCTPDEASDERQMVANALKTLGVTDAELKEWFHHDHPNYL